MDTVEQVRSDIAPFVGDSGKCADDQAVLDALNDARRLVYKLIDARGTVDTLAIQPVDRIYTLPFEFDFVKIGYSSKYQFPMDNDWYMAIDQSNYDRYCGDRIDEDSVNLGDKFASFCDYEHNYNFRIKVMSEDPLDEGVILKWNCVGENGDRVLVTRKLRSDHEFVTFGPNNEDAYIRRFYHVVKPATVGRVKVWIFDPNREVDKLCAIYEPDDINPHYRRYLARSCRANRQVLVKAKRKYRKLLNNTDPVEIATDALINVVQALTSRRNRNNAEFTQNMQLALTYLNKEIATEVSSPVTGIMMSDAYRVSNLEF